MRRLPFLLAIALTPACSDGDASEHGQTVYVAHEGVLAGFDIATGEQIPGEVQGVDGPTDLQPLADGTLLVDLTNSNTVLVVDGNSMLEKARIPTGDLGARPVHTYISPDKSLFLSLHDGEAESGNAVVFIDIAEGSATRFQVVGSTPLGIGHHKAGFSTGKQRIAISNIGDCDDVISVFDFSDTGDIQKLETLTAEEAGWDGTSFPTTCDPTYQMGIPPAPHGMTSSKTSGKVYSSLTGNGAIVAIDIDADPPTFTIIPTHGGGAGYMAASHDGKYVFGLHETPRENADGDPGEACQIGELVVVATASDTLVAEMPLFYGGPDCSEQLLGTDEETANPGKIIVGERGDRLFVATAGGFGVDDARVRKHMIVDVSDPEHPVQLASVPAGDSTSHVGCTMSADGRMLTADNVSGTVTVIDVDLGATIDTITTFAQPKAPATWGKVEGPGYQVGPIH